MQNLVQETPTKIRLTAEQAGLQAVRDALAYEDRSAGFEYLRLRRLQKQDDDGKKCWFVEQNGREALDQAVKEAEADRHCSCLFEDDKGFWFPSGLVGEVVVALGGTSTLSRTIKTSPPKRLERYRDLVHQPRYYQTESAVELLSRTLGGVEHATGLGKSMLAELLIEGAGGDGVIVLVPTLSIAEQMLASLSYAFNRRNVGAFFGGKKESKKKIVVAVGKSLTNLAPDSQQARELAKRGLLIGDESHMLPAETLSKVVLGWLGDVPRRYFLSGTQIRTDGKEKLLKGITGPIVSRVSVREGVDQGFLTRPEFHQYGVHSDHVGRSRDVLKMTRWHLHDNPRVYAHAIGVAKMAVARGVRPVILIQEVDQIPYLVRAGLPAEAGVAHGGILKSKAPKGLPLKYLKADPSALVKAFDQGEIPILVGTQCIGIGTDIKSVGLIIDIVGNAAEIRLRQNIGRGTRLFPGKHKCAYVDYRILGISELEGHADKRAEIFEEVYGPVRHKKVIA